MTARSGGLSRGADRAAGAARFDGDADAAVAPPPSVEFSSWYWAAERYAEKRSL